MITLEGIDHIVVNGGVVVTSDGMKLGSVEQVFLSEDSGQPAFVTVRTGLFGMLESFVPLAGATIDGPRVVVAFDRNRIRNGPRIASDRGSITADEENELYGYYGTSGQEDEAGDTAGDETESISGRAESTEFEATDATADAAGRPEPHAQPHPHPHGPHAGPPPVPPHLRKHEVDGRPHPHDDPPRPPHPQDDPHPPAPRP